MDMSASLAARSYGAARPLTSPDPQAAGGPGASASRFAESFAQVLDRADTTAQAAMTGDADPHALVTALAQTELAVETAVTVRNKVIEAYQEILRMPV